MKHPVTLRLIEVLTKHIEGSKEIILDGVLDGPLLGQQELHFYSQLRGQVLAFREMLDPKEFLLTDEEKENKEVKEE